MTDIFTVSIDEIIHQIKLSCQIPSIVEAFITRKIVARIAEERGIKVEPSEIQQAADSLRLKNNLTSATATWSWLQKHSMSLDDFEEVVYTNVISSKLAEYLFADKVEPYFLEKQLDYAQAVMYEVILDDEDLAMELFYALQEGEMSFYEVAHQYIQDTELRRSGGYRGLMRRTDLKPEISAAVFAATPPQIIKPIVTAKNTHLIFVEELIQPQLNEMPRCQIITDLFSQWIKQQVEQAEVKVNINSDVLVTTD